MDYPIEGRWTDSEVGMVVYRILLGCSASSLFPKYGLYTPLGELHRLLSPTGGLLNFKMGDLHPSRDLANMGERICGSEEKVP